MQRAARWLLSRSDIRPSTVSVIGASRGSELALLAGALLTEVDAVVGISPSGAAWSGLDSGGPVDLPAWTFGGRSLPYLLIGDQASLASTTAQGAGPVTLRPAFEEALGRLSVDDDAVIPVERIGGPVLLVSGRDDTMWPSTPMGRLVERRASAHGVGHLVSHLTYDDAGHTCFGVPGLPVYVSARNHPLTGSDYSFGGTRSGNARARVDSWPKVVAFLHRSGTTS